MRPKRYTRQSDLFLVRFWTQEKAGMPAGESEWGGKVQRVVSGESHEFHNWLALVETLRAMLTATSPPEAGSAQEKMQPGPPASLDIKGEKK